MRTPTASIVLLLLLAGCSSSGGDKDSAVQGSPTPSATRETQPAPSSPATSSAIPDAKDASGYGSAGGAGAGSSAAPVTTLAPGKPAAQKTTKAGTYTLDASGTIRYGATRYDASGTQTLTVDPPRGDRQHSMLHGDQGHTEQDLLVRDTGTYIASLTLTSPAFAGQAKQFRPPTAVLLVPDPAGVGASWSWKAVSTDGKTTVTTSNKVARTETVTIGGRRVPCAVVQTHLVLSGDVSYDAQLTTWYSPDLHLAVKDHTLGKGTALGTPFTTDLNTVMRSLTPS